jgi:hypothetical protein
MSGALVTGDGTIGGGGLTYTYTTFELTAAIGDGTIDAPDIDISLSAQTLTTEVGYGAIGGGSANLAFDDWSAELVSGTGTIGTGNTQLREIVRALFPALSPSDRSFEPPEYAVSKYKTINGAKARRLWASQPGGGTLDLVFENVDDADAESILVAHDVAKGATNDVILPDEVLSGAEGDLLAYMRAPGGQAWSFDAPPEVESVKEGMSTVRVKLSGRRKVQFNSVGSVGGTFAVGAAPVDEIDPVSFDDCDFIGRPPEAGPNPAPGAVWVSKLAAGGSYAIGDAGSVEYGAFGNSYHVVKLQNSGTRVAVIKRNRAGSILWQRVSAAMAGLGSTHFFEIKQLSSGNVLVFVPHQNYGDTNQRLLLFSSSGILLRSRTFELAWPMGVTIANVATARVWGFTSVFATDKTFLLTLSIKDDATFGDQIAFYDYASITPSGFSANQSEIDVRPLANGNIFMLTSYVSGGVRKHHCIELSGNGGTIAQVAAFIDSPSERKFSQATPYSDGSVVLTATGTNQALKIDSGFNQVWYKAVTIPGDGPIRTLLDSSENMYYAARTSTGGGAAPPGWSGTLGASVQNINIGFTSVAYSTWILNEGIGSSYAFLGTNSGIDLANARFIGCSGSGNNVTSHSISVPATSVTLSLSGGQTAQVGTQFSIAAPTAEATYTVARSVPTMAVASRALTYVSETWTFTDPGSTLAWDFFATAP